MAVEARSMAAYPLLPQSARYWPYYAKDGILIDAGTDLNVCDNNRLTPLDMTGLLAPHKGLVQYLCAAGGVPTGVKIFERESGSSSCRAKHRMIYLSISACEFNWPMVAWLNLRCSGIVCRMVSTERQTLG